MEVYGSTVTDTIYFGGAPIATLTGGAYTDFIYAGGLLIAEIGGTQTAVPTYRVTDNLGSLGGSLATASAITGPMNYAPYGQWFLGSTSDSFGFTGLQWDATTATNHVLTLASTSASVAQTGIVTFYSDALPVKDAVRVSVVPAGKESFPGWLYDGSQRLAHFSAGRLATFHFEAGMHIFSASPSSKKPTSKVLQLEVRSGGNYCVRLSSQYVNWGCRSHAKLSWLDRTDSL